MNRADLPIAVVGAGVVGMSCAVRLCEHGRRVVVFAERKTPDTTSDRAGAVFSPFRIHGHPDAAEWTRAACEQFRSLADTASTECGVSMAPLREYFFSPQDGDPWWAAFMSGYARLRDVPRPYADGVRADMPRMDMRRYMPWLTGQFVKVHRGDLRIRRVESISALFDEGFDVVVNCAGVGAGALASDEHVTPYRGQILRVENVLGLNECLIEESRADVTTYVFPFDDYVVLGGTFECGETTEQTDTAAIAAIISRCQHLLHACGVDNADRLAERPIAALAGIRPCRVVGDIYEAVRLEREDFPGGRCIVHNYGHGRAGVSLSWGCANAVARLIESRD